MRRLFGKPGLWLAVALLVFSPLGQAAGQTDQPTPVLEQPAIQYLLQVVESSGCVFIRNGKSHDGTEAAAHMRKKARYFARSIHSPEDFIRLAASRSLLSGTPYFVQCPARTPGPTPRPQPTADWLKQKLSQWRHKPQPNF